MFLLGGSVFFAKHFGARLMNCIAVSPALKDSNHLRPLQVFVPVTDIGVELTGVIRTEYIQVGT
jgi:hypothetical protein